MTTTYKKGEIVWAKIQGYSWWPGRITKIKLNLCIKRNRLGKVILQYEKEPFFYIRFFPNDSMSKVKIKYIKKFIEGYIRKKNSKSKKLNKAIEIATSSFLKENPDLNMDIKKNIFNIQLFSKKKFHLLREYKALEMEEEEQNGENDIQSFIDSEINECEKYKNELKEKSNKNKYLGKKRKKCKNDDESEYNYYSEKDESSDSIDLNKRYNREIKKYSNELYKTNIEIKRKNTFNNIINIFNNIENIIKNDIEYNFDTIKDLLIILDNYTNHSNKTIMNKSISLHKNLISKYLDNFFKCDTEFIEKELLYSKSLFKNCGNKLNNEILIQAGKLCNEILFQIDNINNKNYDYSNFKEDFNINNINERSNSQLSKYDDRELKLINNENDNYFINNINLENNNIYNLNNELKDNITLNYNEESEISNKINNKIKINLENMQTKDNINIDNEGFNNKILSLNNNEPYLKDILNNPNYFNKKPEGQLYPDNFFKDIYLKVDIDSKTELRRKMCLQLYNILKLVLPFCQEDIFKKNVIFLEFLARRMDPMLGNKYMITINMIYNRIKSEAVKIKNKNNIKN